MDDTVQVFFFFFLGVGGGFGWYLGPPVPRPGARNGPHLNEVHGVWRFFFFFWGGLGFAGFGDGGGGPQIKGRGFFSVIQWQTMEGAQPESMHANHARSDEYVYVTNYRRGVSWTDARPTPGSRTPNVCAPGSQIRNGSTPGSRKANHRTPASRLPTPKLPNLFGCRSLWERRNPTPYRSATRSANGRTRSTNGKSRSTNGRTRSTNGKSRSTNGRFGPKRPKNHALRIGVTLYEIVLPEPRRCPNPPKKNTLYGSVLENSIHHAVPIGTACFSWKSRSTVRRRSTNGRTRSTNGRTRSTNGKSRSTNGVSVKEVIWVLPAFLISQHML